MRHLLVASIAASFVLATSFSYALNANHTDNSSSDHMLLANAPPGLKKQGMMTSPSYLGNTPPGWDEGLKKGWNKNKDWRWDKKTKLWENKNWQWDSKTKHWHKTKGWGKK